MGKVIPLRPSERELSVAEAMTNIGDAFADFCKAIERTKGDRNEVCIEKVSEGKVGEA